MVRPSPSAPPTTSLCNFPQEDEVLANCPSLTPLEHTNFVLFSEISIIILVVNHYINDLVN